MLLYGLIVKDNGSDFDQVSDDRINAVAAYSILQFFDIEITALKVNFIYDRQPVQFQRGKQERPINPDFGLFIPFLELFVELVQ